MANSPPALNDTFDEDGLWWHPSHAEDQVAGTLTVSPTGTSLRLIGIIGDLTEILCSTDEPVTIHGMTMSGKPVTLLNTFRKTRHVRFPGIANDIFFVNIALIGIHIDSLEHSLISKSWSRFEGIERWLEHRPFSFSMNFEDRQSVLVVNKSQVERLAAFDGMILQSGSNQYTDQRGTTGFDVTVESVLGIVSEIPQSLRWHLNTVSRLRELASLCTGHSLPLLSLEIHLDHGDASVEGQPAEAQVYFRSMNDGDGLRSNLDLPLISAREILEAEPRAFEIWFAQHALLEPAMHLFFAVTGARSMPINVRFLLAVQALEVFHRRTIEGGLCDKAEFDHVRRTLIEAIPSTAPEPLREKLKATLGFANEPSLMQRLRTIIGLIESGFGELPAGVDHLFARTLVDTRNYLTHFSAELEEKSLDSLDMHWATRRIVMLLTVLTLMRLGVNASTLRSVLGRHDEFQQLWNRQGRPL